MSDGCENVERIKVSFVVIALNAASSLDNLLKCLNEQTYDHANIEVVLVDSNSQDSTKEKMLSFKESRNDFDRVVVLDNPQKTLPCGWNVALKEVTGDAILRVDAHTTFPENFISLNVRDLNKGEDICGGKVVSIPANKDNWSATLNESENSMFGGSFAAFRHAESARYVSTAAFAIYRKAVFDKVGYYNELLTRTEDNEMHYRMKKAGYKFYYDPEIVSYRETRATLGKLLKQKYLNGYWIGRTLGVEPHCFSLYHFIPLLFVLAIVITALMCLLGISWMFLLLWSTYGVVTIIMTIVAIIGSNSRNAFFSVLPVLFLLLHLGYGIGTIIGIANIWKNQLKVKL